LVGLAVLAAILGLARLWNPYSPEDWAVHARELLDDPDRGPDVLKILGW
jgi:hypothetical protein